MSIVLLEPKDFEIRINEQAGQKALCLQGNVPRSMILVYFFLAKCQFCKEVTQFFHTLPTQLKGMNFAVVNAQNIMPLLADVNSNTYFPIREVPYMLLYSGSGWPIERYTGPCNLESVKNFIVAVQQKMVNSNAQAQPPAHTPPSSEPHMKGRVCYMTYGTAYCQKLEKGPAPK